MEGQQSIGIKHVLTLVFLSLIWGTSFILIKKGLVAYNPVQLASLRVSIAGLGFTPVFLYHLKSIKTENIWKYIVVGITGNVVPVIFFALAQTRISSSVAGIANSMTPIFTILIGVLFYQMVVKKTQIIGVFLGFIGVLALILFGKDNASSNNMWYAGFIIGSCVLYAINLNFVKKHFQTENSLKLTAVSFFFMTIPLSVYILSSDIPNIVQTEEGLQAFYYIALLSFMSTMLALIVFYRIVQQTNAVFASSVSYLVPIVAMIWGFVDGEYLGFGHFLSLGLILVGVYMIRED